MSNKSHPFGRLPQQPPRPPMVAIDRFGKMIEAGHLVMFHNEVDLILEVVSVGPVLNPSIQGGQAIQIVLRGQFPVMCAPAQANQGFCIVGESQARIAERAAGNGQPATAPPDPPSGIVLTDPDESALPCGCDAAAGWVCEQHRAEE